MITDMHVHLMGDNGARLLASASHCGIGRLIVSDLADWSEFPEENAIRAGNDRAAAFAAGAPGRVFFLAYVNPQLDSAEEGRYPVEPDDAGRGQFLQLSGEEFEQVARGCDHFGRSGGGCCGRRGAFGSWLGHRRFNPPAQLLLRSYGLETDLRQRFAPRACGLCLVPRPDGSHRTQRGGLCGAHEYHKRT